MIRDDQIELFLEKYEYEGVPLSECPVEITEL